MNPLDCTNLVELLCERSLSQPNLVGYTFLVDGNKEEVKITYQELDQKARSIAVELQRLKVTPGERALLLYPSGLEFIVAFFGCLYAGIVAVPVYPPRRNQRLKRLQVIFKDSEPRFALTTTSVLANFEKSFSEEPELACLHCIATDKIPDNKATNWQKPTLEANTLAFLQYTSGSTGTPKGVMVSHGNLLHNQSVMQYAMGHTEQTIVVGWLPLFHDMGLIGNVLQPLYLGVSCILMSPEDFIKKPFLWLQAISRYQATTSGGPNFAYDLCIDKITPEQRATLDLSSWDVAFNGAEPIRSETIERFTQTFAPCGFRKQAFYPCYGMAETTLLVSGGLKTAPPVIRYFDATALEQNLVIPGTVEQKGSRALVGCGRICLDEEIVIADPVTLKQCPDNQVGEIWVSGSSVAQGYWQRTEETEKTFQAYLKDTPINSSKPFLRTGDLGFLQNGELFVTGRLKDVIIIRGRNHYPQDIELTVEQSHQALKSGAGAVFGVEIDGQEQLVIVQEVERTYLRNLDVDRVVEAIQTAVSQFHELQVHAVLLLKTGTIPKTSSGKIQRHACRAGFLAGTLNALNTINTADKAINPQAQSKEVSKKMQFSLLYFSSNEAEFTDEKYKLFLEGAKFADRNGFTAVWTPERHFHAFGGLYPNPSVLSAALTSLTKHIRLRAGSVVLPLHDPIRVVEEWSVVDNLSYGRVDLAFARGWNANDFVLSPDAYADSKEIMFSNIQTIQKLWRGETISLPNGVGKQTEIKVYPLPMQKELSIWITCTGGKERFIEAGASGFNILTALLFQPVEELAEKIALYREARKQHGYDPDSGKVTLMLHTFIGEDLKQVRNLVRTPFIEYMKSSVNLWRQGSEDIDKLSESEKENLLAYAFERYFHTSALFGTPRTCLEMVQRLQAIGVDEIACLIDFGIDGNTVLASLNYLNHLKQLVNSVEKPSVSPTSQKTLVSPLPVNTDNKIINNSLSLPAPQIETKLETPFIPENSLLEWLSEVIVEQIAKSLGKQPSQISLNRSFHSFGIDSLKAVEIMEILGEKFGFAISPTLLFEYPTPRELALHIIQGYKTQLEKYLLLEWGAAKSWAIKLEQQPNYQSHSANLAVEESSSERIRAEDIAVIGMSGRFPQSPNLESFWQLLLEGKNAISEIPNLRWNLQDWYDKNPDAPNKTYSRWGGFLDGVDQFDPLFFQISPREAELMDPQQRLFLEVAWEALEDSGYSPESFAQTQVGVFVGCSNNGYYQRIAPALKPSDYSAGIGNQNAIIANRVSFLLNLRGPSILVDTMCSSSLVALHMACRSLQQGECTSALAGGVNILLSPEYYVAMSRMKMHSPNGRCASFDRQADGIVLGEGAGAILLKPLSRALEDGDRIYAVIKGSAVNHDGRTNGITAPNPRSHAEVICQALDAAGISADKISYIEAHGTGTSLGDPIEIEGLTKAFRKYTQRQQFCKIGSVKTNIGHLECAAGIAQVIKVILALQHRQIPPNLHWEQPNPLIRFDQTPFEVNTKLSSWQSADLRRAGISSFGIGGTNAHIVIEEAPLGIQNSKYPTVKQAYKIQNSDAMERPMHLLTLSAKTEKALIELISHYETHLAAHPDLDLGDICFTANTGRSHFQHRATVLCTSTSDLHQKLVNFSGEKEVTGIKIGRIQETTGQKVAFLFTGQGSQYPDMGRYLYETQPTFRKILDYCNETLLPYLPEPLLKILYPQPGEISPLDQTMYAQPVLFSLEYALVQLWKSWGVEPSVVMGHSVGEYVAATVAGVFSLEDGLKLIAERARLMQSLPPTGEMVAVFAGEAVIRSITEIDLAEVAIAAYNSPENTVISGEKQAIRQICANLEAAGIQTTKLNTSHAFHSPLIKPILAEFRRIAATVTYHPPQIDIISNVTGKQLISVDPEYLCNHLISSVQFAQGLQQLNSKGYEIFVEIGPKPTLSGIGSKYLESQGVWLPSLNQRRGDWQQILETLAELYVRGVQVQWSGFDGDYSRRRVQLPTYPFQRKSYWIQAPVNTKNHQIETTISAPSSATNGNGQQVAISNGNQVGAEIFIDPKSIQPQIKRLDTILAQFHSRMVNLLKAEPLEVDIHAPFLEFGADSLMLVDAISYIYSTYGIKITINQLFEELTTIYAVASYIDRNLPPEPPQPIIVDSQNPSPSIVESHRQSDNQQTTQAQEPRVTVAQTAVERIMLQQLQVMSQVMSEQLDLLRATGLPTENVFSSANGNSHPASPAPVVPVQIAQHQDGQTTSPATKSFSGVAKSSDEFLTPTAKQKPQNHRQDEEGYGTDHHLKQQHLKAFIANYTQKTQASKQRAQRDRSFLADSRAVAGFRPSTKEMVYPIIGERAQGARFWDIDGNEYIDLTMGFGVLLFGHAAPFITAAVEEYLQQGIQIGPQANYAGEVAALISELTGMERVTFCNSGTEAVMTALRLARTKTGRTKIAIFAGAYHGHFDGILAKESFDGLSSVPIAPGITANAVADVLVLDYGEPQSLEILQAHTDELAAVLVEPVQGRSPDLQPREFLQQLRQLTAKAGIALIFDEVLVGFRIHLGGAQAWFGIEADIATYGKIVGGGIPIGVVAGKASYMNGIDGGLWNYGDASYPQAEKTFFAGTFNKNHLGMAVARAVLQYLKKQGTGLQEQLNERTSYLARTLNTYFEHEEVPVRIVYFGSLFRFAVSGNFDLLFYYLISKGVYIWEGRNCFLSIAHTDADIEYVIQAVKQSIEEMRAVGYIPSSKLSASSNGNGTVKTTQNGAINRQLEALPLVAIAREGKLPLSYAQQRLWFLNQLEPNSAFYNIPAAMRLQGQLNVAALAQSLEEIVRRHEALRTNFTSVDGQAIQIIHPPGDWQLTVLDWQHLSVSEQEHQTQQLATNEAQRPFDLATEPLLRVTLLVLSPQEHILLLCIHHIVSDGWSMGVFVQEIVTLYSAYCQGQASPLAELSIQYADFAIWQRQWLQGQVLQSQLDYWQTQLAGAPALLELPTDRPRPAVQSFRGAQQSFTLAPDLTAALNQLSRQQGVTLFMTLLAGFDTLLYRYTGQADILVGSPIANRNHSEIKGLIGFFVNTLVLRTDLSGDPSFGELLKRVREMTLAGYAHQDLPFELLVEALQPERNLSHTPLFQVMFELDNTPMSEMALPGLTLSPLATENSTAAFDLTLSVEQTAEGLVGSWEYNSDLFDAPTITRMMGHFQTLLAAIVADPEQRISQLPLLTAPEQQQLLFEWNDTHTEYPQHQCIHQLFEAQVERTPDAVAVVFADQQLTYQELNARANQLAHYLRILGVHEEVLVGLCLERSLEQLVSILAILKAGGAYLPLDPTYPQQRLSYLLADAQVQIVLTQQSLLVSLPNDLEQVICCDTDAQQIAQQAVTTLNNLAAPENAAVVFYTSGSTGTPKGVVMTHQGLVNYGLAALSTLELNYTDRFLQLASSSFDVFLEEILPTLLAGAVVVLPDEPNALAATQLHQLISQHQVTVMELTTAHWHEWVSQLVSFATSPPSSLRLVLVGGETILPEHLHLWQQFHLPLIHVYGLTETTITSTMYQLPPDSSIPPSGYKLPIGRPLPNTTVYLLDEQLQPVPVGVPGEVYIGGAGLSRGYLHRPQLTAERFIPNPWASVPGERLYKTGDVGRYLADGNIEFWGRRDEQVKLRGFRIELAEVEAVLSQHPSVQQTVVIAREDVPGNKRLVAYLVTQKQETPTITQLRQYLKEKLPEYMIPGAFVFLDSLPLTPNGKVDRRNLPAPESRPELEVSFVAARTPIEQMLADIWADVLGIEQVGIDDNFFTLGGHSLLATQLISRVRSIFKVELPVRSLFEASTIASLSQYIQQWQQQLELFAPPLLPVARVGELPLSYAQQRLWFFNQLEPNSAAYNMPGAMRLQGQLNIAALAQSLQEIVRRHEALRTNFTSVDGQAIQIIHPPGDWQLTVLDWQHLSVSEQEHQTQQLATNEAQRPFDLATEPLLRVTLLVLSPQEHILFFCMHHIVSDGWSIGVFVQEIVTLYSAYCQGQASPLPELGIQYADFAIWQRQWLQGQVLQSQLDYWQTQLAGAPALLELPTDRPRPALQSFRGAQQSFTLAPDLTAALNQLSRQQGVTLFMTLLAGFDTLLYRYTGQADILVGSPIANRNHSEIEGLIGFFVNTLVLRTDLSGNPSFGELLKRVREMTLAGYAHQDLPFELLVEALQPERNLSHTPLFQVMFELDNTPMSEMALPGLTLSPLATENSTAAFDLTLSVEQTAEGLVGSWEYNSDLFDAPTITRMMGHFQTLLAAIVADPEQRISQLPLLTAPEQQQLLFEWNDTHTEYPQHQCIHQLFEAQVERTPDAVAVVFADQQLTYQELNARANQLAHYLRILGVHEEVLVGLCLERSLEQLVSILAILKAGGAYLPLDPTYPQQRLSYLLADAQVQIVLTQQSLLVSLPNDLEQVICCDTDAQQIAQQAVTTLNNLAAPENAAVVFYTSGSTGTPKGVVMTHQGLVNYGLAALSTLELNYTDRFLQLASSSFDVFLEEILPTLLAGAVVVLPDEPNALAATQLHQLISQHQVTVMELTTAHWHEWVSQLVSFATSPPSSLRLVLVGGETILPEHLHLWQQFHLPLIHVYGLTETTITSTMYQLPPDSSIPPSGYKLPIGRPLPNTTVYLLDEQLQPVPVGVPGEVYIGGAGLSRGYLHRPQLTAERFIPNPWASVPGERLYKTGDVGRYLADGNIEFWGRRDEQVKLRGFRIELAEVEAVLSQHPSVQQTVVIAREDVPGNKRLVAYLVTQKQETPTITQLRQYLKEKLPEYMIPGAFVFLDSLPLTPNGKVDRRNLPAPESRPELEVSFVAARTPIEQMLADIWADVLGIEQVGIDDNFFTLGGHSLLATQLISRVRSIFKVELPVRSLFEASTIASLSQYIQQWQQQLELFAPPLLPVARVGELPLSYAQQRLWFFNQLEPNSAAYNMPGAMRLQGQLNIAALAQSLQEIVRRHEALRTNFTSVDGQAIQIIHPPGDWQLTVLDWQHLSVSEQEHQTQQLATNEAQRPFDLATEPLLRVTLLVLSPQEHILFFCMHHIVSDGWSIGVFVQEIVTLYSAYCQGQASPLPELGIQYADFAIWQRQWLQGQVLQSQLDYWQTQLAGAPALLELPTDRPRPALQSFRGAQQSFTLAPDLTAALNQLSRQQGVTLFMTLLAGFDTLLYRYTGQADILVGSPIANRNHSEIEGLIGFFVNTLVLRTDLSGNPSFGELLKRVREMTLAGYAHQDLPFELLVEALQPERNLSHTPLFQVMFELDNTPMSEMALPGLTLSPLAAENSTAAFDLTLSVEETAEGLVGSWQYNTDLFDATRISRMSGHFQTLLAAIVADPQQPISQLPLLTASEQQQLLFEWNDTHTEYPQHQCIHQLFEAQVERTPDAVAVVFADQQLTYRELNARANQLAHYLRTLGVKPEVLVAICVERSLEMVIGLLGILKAGGAYVPLDPDYPQERLSFMLADAQVSVLLTQQRLVERLPQHQAQVICLDETWEHIAQHNQENLVSGVTPNDLADVIYTSGSTGIPKGVMVTHSGLCNLAQAQIQLFNLLTSSRILQFASFSFDASISEIIMALGSGATLYLSTKDFLLPGSGLIQLLRDYGITHITLPPSALAFMPVQEIPALQTIIVAGETCPVDLISQWSVGRRFFNAYGPTEATVCATVAQWALGDRKLAIGRPIANTQVYILDSYLQPVPIGVPGELHIGGVGLARGYLNREELTQEKFIPHPFSNDPNARLYKTGDLARYLADGNIEYLGRIDHQVKIRGFRIELAEIETVLSLHEAVLQTVVIAREDIPGNKRLVAYLVTHPEQTPTITQLRQYLKEKLPEYMIPGAFVFLDSLPLTPNGKVDRRSLPAPESRGELEVNFVAARTPIEQILADIWADVLGVKQIGIDDNFFTLGGHSLLATQLISRVRSIFKVELPVRSLFEASTIASLSQYIQQWQQQLELFAPPLLPVARVGELPLSYAQQRLWFFNQLEPNNAAYNMPGAMRLQGQLNVAALAQSLQEIVRRHEALRTNFTSLDGQAIQIIHPPGDWQLTVLDWQHLSVSEQEHQTQQLATNEAQRPFDLATEPLLRVTLLVLSPPEYILLFCMHHIVSDGWSMGVFVQEIVTLYSAYCQGQASPLAELGIQYADFAIWQRQWLQGQVLQSQLDYWQTQLAGAPALLELPTDRPRPALQSFRGAQQSFTLAPDLTAALNQLSRQQGVTLFMTLLAGFDTLLYRYTGQADILVGSPIANRNHSEIEGLIGFFVNTLVLRTDLSGDPSFGELLKRVREMTLAGYAHQDLPFELLVEALQPERNLSHTPLFQVMFALQNAPMSEMALPGLTLSPLATENSTAAFDLTLSVEQTAEGLVGSWEYNSDLFDAPTITRMMGHFQTLLAAIVADPEQRISQLPLLTAPEQQQLLFEWNDTHTEYPQHQCIHQLFEAQVERTPDAVAVVFADQQLTYQELNARANQLAHYLRILGVHEEVLVGLCLERSLEQLVSILAILKAGGAYLPLDPTYPQQRLSYLLADAQVQIVLTQQSLLVSLPNDLEQVICCDTDAQQIAQQAVTTLNNLAAPENAAVVFYTSGSTGTPKGVVMTHQGLVNYGLAALSTLELNYTDRFLQLASSSFDVFLEEILPTLLAGAVVVLPDEPNALAATQLHQLISQHQVTVMELTTAHWHEWVSQLVSFATSPPSSLRLVLVGGETILPEHLHLWQQFHLPLIHVYGLTETTITSTMYQLPPDSSIPRTGYKLPIGRPLPNTTVYLLDEQLQPVPVGVPGEVYIGGAGLSRGYLHRPQLTAERFIPNPWASVPGERLYKTGDVGRYLADGNIEFWGRRDEQVKLRGFRIELAEVEAVLSQHPSVQQTVVIAREDVPGNKRLVAYLVTQKQETPTITQLRQYLKEKLPEYMIPGAFVFLDSLPLTPNGKVDRRNLPAPDINSLAVNTSFVPPLNIVEQQLAEIWAEVLNIYPVGVKDNFFELGGHSLLAVQLMAKIEQQFARNLPLATLFQHPTIEQLAIIFRQPIDALSWSPLVPIQASGSQPPFFCLPGLGGNPIYLYNLAHHLGRDQPFYSLQALGLDGESEPQSKIEDIASYYIQAIQTIQPQGPYFLGGHSFGGHVAYEMACQLNNLGYEVALLAILDAGAPDMEINQQDLDNLYSDDADWLREIGSILEELYEKSLELSYEVLKSLSHEAQLNYLQERMQAVNLLPPDISIKQLRGLVQVYKTNARIVYQPKEVYPSQITCFISSDEMSDQSSETDEGVEDSRFAWDKFSAKSPDIHIVPGTHLTMMSEPHVRILAERLRTCIQQAQKVD